jgi:hypothetical protein
MQEQTRLVNWILIGLVCGFLSIHSAKGQDKIDEGAKPLKIELSDDGSKYVRFIVWHQQWVTTSNLNSDSDLKLSILTRRSRFLTYAQMHPRLLILSHWGINNLTPLNIGTTASSQQSALFLHDAWVEFKISDALFIGTGLHYFNGLTRLASASTLNFMGMDAPTPFNHWHTLGITDQFGRQLGIYAKGEIDKFTYRFSINNAASTSASLGGASLGDVAASFGQITSIKAFDPTSNKGDLVYQGYFNYQFKDKEPTKLPYWAGSYLGEKEVFNIGAGFYYQPHGMIQGPINTQVIDDYKTEDIFHIALDAFYDLPLNEKLSLTNYTSIIKFNYHDKNYVNRWNGSGLNLFSQVGLYLKKQKLMPYVMFQYGDYGGLNNPLTALNIGVNYYVMGHNAKLTLEFFNVENFGPQGGRDDNGNPIGLTQIRAQAHIYF